MQNAMNQNKQNPNEEMIENQIETQIEDKDRSLEETFALLDQVVESLEDSNISLEESFRTYEKGIRLLKECNEKIDAVEKKVLILSEGGQISEMNANE